MTRGSKTAFVRAGDREAGEQITFSRLSKYLHEIGKQYRAAPRTLYIQETRRVRA
jgi:hypothetical protein